MIGFYWRAIDAELADQVTLLQQIPEDAKVYPMVKMSDETNAKKRDLASFHTVCYAVIDRHAYVPSLLAIAGHTPMHYKAPRVMYHVDAASFAALEKVDWPKVFAEYDYLWGCRLPDDYRQYLAEHCALVGANGEASLWRVKKSLK
jgi:hypothetical protein